MNTNWGNYGLKYVLKALFTYLGHISVYLKLGCAQNQEKELDHGVPLTNKLSLLIRKQKENSHSLAILSIISLWEGETLTV